MRIFWPIPTFLIIACASTPEPAVLDPVAHGQMTVDGFLEASQLVSERLGSAAAWGVFPDVEDHHGSCTHRGLLFGPDAPPRPLRIDCSHRPNAPAGMVYHLLVVLEDEEDLVRLTEDGLQLEGVPHLAPHDDHEPLGANDRVWMVTSIRGSLLFDAPALRQRMTLVDPE